MIRKIFILVLIINSINIRAESVNYFETENANPATAYSVESKYYSANRKVIIHTPASYDKSSNSRYPVLYLLDGKKKIKHVIFTAEMLASKRKMPEIIIVALPGGDTRQQDYTPNYLSQHSSDEMGNANNFTKFLELELIPYIDSNFRTEPYRILSGHSRSGLFVVDNLVSKTGLFQAHLAFSPALWPNDFSIIDKISKNLKIDNSYEGFLYANVGDEENSKMKTSLAKLVSLLDKFAPKKFKWRTDIAPDESHGTTPIIGHHIALRKLYTNWDNPWEEYSEHGLKVVQQQYALLSKEFKYRVIPDERALNSIGYRFLRKKKIMKAIEAFKMNVQYHPNSANAYDSLADALEMQGLLEEAMSAMNKAVSLLSGENDPNYISISLHHKKLENGRN